MIGAQEQLAAALELARRAGSGAGGGDADAAAPADKPTAADVYAGWLRVHAARSGPRYAAWLKREHPDLAAVLVPERTTEVSA